jgi:hypothetical protein
MQYVSRVSLPSIRNCFLPRRYFDKMDGHDPFHFIDPRSPRLP